LVKKCLEAAIYGGPVKHGACLTAQQNRMAIIPAVFIGAEKSPPAPGKNRCPAAAASAAAWGASACWRRPLSSRWSLWAVKSIPTRWVPFGRTRRGICFGQPIVPPPLDADDAATRAFEANHMTVMRKMHVEWPDIMSS